ncbi:tetratricopeptide repeat protein [Mangrovivirga cuniculi]|uniref:Uncharacterized protein n=1 Tax=Mangrovivirga cuniculi TaxID=2715131 RepID=A0A4D7JKV2_9BACT|nr:tetratricopeptide repeat protein [Mangrovivirga cuniculi]QCK14110.1 hypothetical protein DCC35_04765 [Mangrovivirga cuniculi]
MSKNSLFFVFAIIAFLNLSLFAQRGQSNYSTRNKKAIEYFEGSENYMIRRQYDQAIDLLQQAIKKDDDFIEAYLRLGQCYQATSKPDLALQTFQKSLELDPNNNYPIIRLQLAELYFNDNDYNKAKEYYEEFIYSKPNQRLLGLAQQRLENSNYAIKFFKTNKDTSNVKKVRLPDPLINFNYNISRHYQLMKSRYFLLAGKDFIIITMKISTYL